MQERQRFCPSRLKLHLNCAALSGRRRGYLRADSVENLRGCELDVLQALRQKLGLTLVKLDVVLGCCAGLKADGVTHDKRNGLGFGLADSFRSGVEPLVAVQDLVSELVNERGELLGRQARNPLVILLR